MAAAVALFGRCEGSDKNGNTIFAGSEWKGEHQEAEVQHPARWHEEATS